MNANFINFVLLFVRLPKEDRDPQHRFTRIISAIRRIRIAAGLVAFSLLIGTVGYVVIDDYRWFDAYYMAVITLASVGFSEVKPLSDAGRLFTTFLILFNVGLFAYSISTITSIFADGGIASLFNDFRMHRQITDLQQHTIICGFGRHAEAVTQELRKQEVAFILIENDPAKVDHLRENTSFLFVEGDATQDEVLEEAGIRRAAALVTALPNDADNMFIVLSARQINPELRIISRATNQVDAEKLRRAGASHTVVPERIGGRHMATLVYKPDLVEFSAFLSEFGPNNVLFEEMLVSRLKPQFQSLSVREFTTTNRVMLMALRQPNGQYAFNPSPEMVLQPEFHIVILGNAEEVTDFLENALASSA